MKVTKEQLEGKLKNNKLIVTFTKVDGTERKMYCTLMEEFLPKKEEPKDGEEVKVKKTRKVNPNVLPVWDIEAEGWRSFRIDNVTNFVVDND